MPVERLELTNFRGFAAFETDFHPELTVFVGENGTGKSTVIAGLAASLASITSLSPDGHFAPWPSDLHVRATTVNGVLDLVPQSPCALSVTGRFEAGSRAELRREISLDGQVVKVEHAGELDLRNAIKLALQKGVDVPLVAAYLSQRGTRPNPGPVEARRDPGSRRDGWAQAFEPNLQQRGFVEWMYQQTLIELQEEVRDPRLRAVSASVAALFDEAKELRFSIKRGELEVVFDDRRLPFSMLSDGQRLVVLLAADIAWRASVLNPQLGENAAALTEGVVLIDEIELHLHPKWQRRVLGDLRRAFPKLQFIVTTHSPQVLASVSAENVRVLKDSKSLKLERGTLNRDASDVLEAGFGDPGRNPEVAKKMNDLRDAVDADRVDDARRLIAELHEKIEGDDPELFFLEQQLPPEDARTSAP